MAREWYEKQLGAWSAGYATNTLSRMENNLLPWLGRRNVGDIEASELLACLRRVEARGAHDLAHRCHEISGRIFRYAIAIGKAKRDPSQDIRGALAPRAPEHYATITDPKGIGSLLRAIDSYQGDTSTRLALRMAPYVFVRPGELRRSEWSEFDLDAGEWRIPAAKMKMEAPHFIPLAPQVLAILKELHPLTTRLNETGWKPGVIERQLAHCERNQVRAAYNYAEHVPERRQMMIAWADYLDGLRSGADVIALRGAA